MADRQQVEGGWHLDRRVPIALIIAILVNFAGIVWIAAQQDARITANEKSIGQIERTIDSLPVDVATMRLQISNIERSVQRIEEVLAEERRQRRDFDERSGGR